MDNISVFRKRELQEKDDFLSREQFKKLQEMLTCPICLSILNQPVYTKSCSHRFCKDCIERAIRTGGQKECPLCRKEVGTKRMLRQDTEIQRLADSIYGNVEIHNKQIEDKNSQFIKDNYGELSLNMRKSKFTLPKLSKQESAPKLQKTQSDLSISQQQTTTPKEKQCNKQKEMIFKENFQDQVSNSSNTGSVYTNPQKPKETRTTNNSRSQNYNNNNEDIFKMTEEEKRLQQELFKQFEQKNKTKQRRRKNDEYEYMELQSTRKKKYQTDSSKKKEDNKDESQNDGYIENEDEQQQKQNESPKKSKRGRKSQKKKNQEKQVYDNDNENEINDQEDFEERNNNKDQEQQFDQSQNQDQDGTPEQHVEIPLDNDDNDQQITKLQDLDQQIQLEKLFEQNPNLFSNIETFITCRLERLPKELLLPIFKENVFKTNSKITIDILQSFVCDKLHLKQTKKKYLQFYVKTQDNQYESLSPDVTLIDLNNKYWDQSGCKAVADSSDLFEQALQIYNNQKNNLNDGENRVIYYAFNWKKCF